MKRTSALSGCFMYGIFGLLFGVHDKLKSGLLLMNEIWVRSLEVDNLRC